MCPKLKNRCHDSNLSENSSAYRTSSSLVEQRHKKQIFFHGFFHIIETILSKYYKKSCLKFSSKNVTQLLLYVPIKSIRFLYYCIHFNFTFRCIVYCHLRWTFTFFLELRVIKNDLISNISIKIHLRRIKKANIKRN